MRVKVGSLIGKKGESLFSEAQIDPTFVQQIPEVVEVITPVAVKVTVTNTGNGFLVRGEVTFDVVMNCTRCLTDFAQKITTEIEDEFVPADQSREELDENPLFVDAAPVFKDDELDLTDLIQESVLLSFPMKIVCSDDCKGMCQTCGQVLNDGACKCDNVSIDPRLAQLQDLFTKQERRKK